MPLALAGPRRHDQPQHCTPHHTIISTARDKLLQTHVFFAADSRGNISEFGNIIDWHVQLPALAAAETCAEP